MSALERQVSGKHYKDMAIQPVEFFDKHDVPYIEANMCKYLARYKAKNGIEDLRKAEHYRELREELGENHWSMDLLPAVEFCAQFPDRVAVVMLLILAVGTDTGEVVMRCVQQGIRGLIAEYQDVVSDRDYPSPVLNTAIHPDDGIMG